MASLDDPAVRDILGEGRQLHVAVATQHGPHVTPELYALAGGRLWFAAASSTVKSRVLRRDPRVGAMVRAGGRAVVLTGTVTPVDPRRPKAVLADLAFAKAAAEATVAFGLRNAADLAAFAADLGTGKLGASLPPRRVLFGVDVVDLHVTDGGGDAVVGWETDRWPIALPATWDGRSRTGALPVELIEPFGLAAEAAACVVHDRYVAPGPAAKQGRLLRGRATLETSTGRYQLSVERRSHWRGITSWSEAVGQESATTA